MQQTIDIRVKATGQRVDIYPNETIEVNMGGISLLNLADRTVSYTNSFKIPRTPANEQLFEFASQPTRNNRPSIKVIITKGLFQKDATLKVKEFEGDYKCEVSYDDVDSLDYIKKTFIKDFTGDSNFLGQFNLPETLVSPLCKGIGGYIYLLEDYRTIPTNDKMEGGLFCTIGKILSDMTDWSGITFSGSVLSDPFFINSYYHLKGCYIKKVSKTYTVEYTEIKDLFSVILKEICLLFALDVTFSDKNIAFTKIPEILSRTPINYEKLSFTKPIYSGLANRNVIKYKLDSEISYQYMASDVFTGDGVGEKVQVQLGIYLPKTGLYAYSLEKKNTNSSIVICSKKTHATSEYITLYGSSYLQLYIQEISFFDLSDYYSSILNPIFANPVILSASGYIDPLTADSIMNTRIINSVKLGGRYWVDEMKYNLTTGNSVLKLIKLS